MTIDLPMASMLLLQLDIRLWGRKRHVWCDFVLHAKLSNFHRVDRRDILQLFHPIAQLPALRR